MSDDGMQWAGPIAPPDAKSLADRYAVGQLIKTYALGIDIRNYPLCRSVFTTDAHIEGSRWSAPVDEYLPKAYGGAAVYAATQHNITNQHIAIDGDTALMWSFAIAHHMEEPGNGRENMIVGVLYKDQCQRFPKGWLIKKRNARLTWIVGPVTDMSRMSSSKG